MNDFERKLSQQPFRAPPPDLCAVIFGRGEAPSHIVEPARWTWRDWFWPSPHAWGALAALWIFFAVISAGNQSAEHAGSTAGAMAEPQFNATLLSYHNTSDLNHVLDFAN